MFQFSSMICNIFLVSGDKVEKIHDSQGYISVLINRRKSKRGKRTAAILNKFISVPIENSANLLFTTLNARSVKNNADAIFNFVLKKRIDLWAITETRLASEVDNPVIKKLVLPNYKFIHVNRLSKRRGGGVEIFA